MYPLPNTTLTFFELVRHWARDFRQHPPEEELLDYLVSSFWNGYFETFALPNGGILSRRQALQAVANSAPHPGFFICSTSESVPTSKTPSDDGGVFVDLNTYIVLPDEEKHWSADVVSAAYNMLGACPLNAFSKPFAMGMECQTITKDQFGAFCDLRSHPHPGFWFGEEFLAGAPGFGGRPSGMRLIEVELRRRAELGQLAPTLAEESNSLANWAKEHLPAELPAPAAKSIGNALRGLYKKLRGPLKVPET